MAWTTQEPAIWPTIVCCGRATSRATPAARIRGDVDPVNVRFRLGSDARPCRDVPSAGGLQARAPTDPSTPQPSSCCAHIGD